MENPKFNVSALIVTYSDRGPLVQRLCRILYSSGVSKIFMIDNNSRPRSKQILNDLKTEFGDSLHLISFEKNVGTAVAFKAGMSTIRQDPDSKFIWILDDDNIPEESSLSELKLLWGGYPQDDKEKTLMVASFRESKNIYRRAVVTGKPDIIIGERNYFRAFHLARLFSCIKSKSRRRSGLNAGNVPEYGDVSAVPYGGMFFHKNLLDVIGYPDERFYIYSDDHEFSHRVILRGGRIILSLNSIVHDVQESWNAKGLGVFNISKHPCRSLLYYSIRNRVYLELRVTVNNYIVYFVNAFIYTVAVFLISLLHLKLNNFLAFWRGLYDGLSGRLGIHRKYKLS
jgi:GT2 family glycosyltransferase